jgi:hypothetical protein
MSHDADKDRLIEKYYPDAEHRIVLDYVAKRAAQTVIDDYGKRMVLSLAGKAALGALFVLVGIGALMWGALTKLGGQ